MTTEVSVCNRALQILGADSIQALTDDNVRGRAMATAYQPVRDAELRRRRWKFSLTRAALPALAAAPTAAPMYTRQFQLPNECLRVIQVGDYDLGDDLADYRVAPTELFSIEGRVILTSFAAPLNIRQITQILDASLFDAAFAEYFSSRLAYETCEAITQSDSKKQSCKEHARDALREGVRANALESAPAFMSDGSWVSARSQ